jgi:hypothetical protein
MAQWPDQPGLETHNPAALDMDSEEAGDLARGLDGEWAMPSPLPRDL